MSYFSHAYQKVFWAKKGFLNTANVKSVNLLSTAGVGKVAFADQSQAGWPSVIATSAAVTAGKPLTFLATSLYGNDKIGPFHGGYQETTKSKTINPKYVSRFYRVDPVAATTHIIGVGATPNLNLSSGTCCPTFYCNETYNLRIDMKGSPALRFLNHNYYQVVSAHTGCCSDTTPELVDPATVMSEWIKYMVADPIFWGLYGQTSQRLVNVGMTSTCDGGTTWDLYLPDNAQTGVAGVYFESDGVTLNAAGTAFQASVESGSGVTFGTVAPLSSYVSTFTPATPNCCSGLVIESAMVDTKFGDCSFQTTDKFELEPLLVQASMLDETGDPCVFEQLCISDGITPSGVNSSTVYPAIQFGTQAMGSGEEILRSLILSERYQQNHFASSDMRIREITQGFDITDVVNRNTFYFKYYIQHNIPRPYNPSGVYDNDQYLLEIPMETVDANFEAFMATWLAAAGSPVVLETF